MVFKYIKRNSSFSSKIWMGKHSKKSKKHKKSSKRKDSSSSEDEWVEAELIVKQKKHSKIHHDHSSDQSSDEEIIKKRKSRRDRSTSSSSGSSLEIHSTKKKKRNLKKKKKERNNSSSEYSDKDEHRKQSKHPDIQRNQSNKTPYKEEQADTVNKREEWMELSTSFSSISNQDRRRQRELDKNEQKKAQQYDPTKCPRELNPYWKDGGDGLPKFQKPKDNDDNSDDNSYRYNRNKTSNNHAKHQPTWRKSTSSSSQVSKATKTADMNIGTFKESKIADNIVQQKESPTVADEILTEKELNLLAGKLVKAEIMGNNKLANQLKEKLENGRKALAQAKIQGEEVLLTHTDRQGYSKPLPSHSETGETSGSKKQRKKAMDTHKDKQRVRYFPDDDKYSLKQMFENETFKSSSDQDREFMKIASNIRKNDDLDDLFADNVRRKKSDAKLEEASRSKAINEHNKMSDSLDRCSKCIQSSIMQKHLIISMGEYVYLSLPAHEPLLEGHCLIIPIRHVSSITQLDENEWDEMVNFQKALIRLSDSKGQELVFFEIAIGFHRYPHMILECVPMPKEEGEMAPIYFKKAIDESETEWSQNKKLVSLKGRGLRRAIPKGLPYFSVMFGMNDGFAHVIEDEKLFPKNFAQEIIGGILDLHHSKWRNPSRQPYDVQSKRVLAFSSEWKEFDCTIQN